MCIMEPKIIIQCVANEVNEDVQCSYDTCNDQVCNSIMRKSVSVHFFYPHMGLLWTHIICLDTHEAKYIVTSLFCSPSRRMNNERVSFFHSSQVS
jgi:hypothetical protein